MILNPEELSYMANLLDQGKTILYPTDTVWGIGCDATNELAVKKIYQIKQRAESKSLIILVSSLEMLQKYVQNIPKKAIEILDSSMRPTTIIYKNPIGLAKNVIASDTTIAIRIVQDAFCKDLINSFGKPIVSTSANLSEQPTPNSFSEISTTILESVDYIVNLRQDNQSKLPSRILRITDSGEIEVIRD
jgi:L-threonylcarbamoyladenylate synthase